MLNIYEEIRIILLRKGLSMRKLAIKMNEENCKVPVEGGLSNSFLKENVKFKTVQQILSSPKKFVFLCMQVGFRPTSNLHK